MERRVVEHYNGFALRGMLADPVLHKLDEGPTTGGTTIAVGLQPILQGEKARHSEALPPLGGQMRGLVFALPGLYPHRVEAQSRLVVEPQIELCLPMSLLEEAQFLFEKGHQYRVLLLTERLAHAPPAKTGLFE